MSFLSGICNTVANAAATVANAATNFWNPYLQPAQPPAAEVPAPAAEVPAPAGESPSEAPAEPHMAETQEKAQEAPLPVAPPKPLEVATSVEHGLLLLKAEQCKRLEEKAHGLNQQVKTVHEKIKQIDTLLSLISQYSQKNRDGTDNTTGTVDCTIPEISSVVASLRRDNISIPLPEGPLQKSERGHVVNVLSNQRSLLSDEQKEHSQEFQQCAVERNSLFQSLMALLSELHRMKSKILGNISTRSS